MPISKIEMNMDISRNIYEGRSNNCFISMVQKVATYSLIPLLLVGIFEAIVKNLVLINLANLVIVAINKVHSLISPTEPAPALPPAVPPAPVAAVPGPAPAAAVPPPVLPAAPPAEAPAGAAPPAVVPAAAAPAAPPEVPVPPLVPAAVPAALAAAPDAPAAPAPVPPLVPAAQAALKPPSISAKIGQFFNTISNTVKAGPIVVTALGAAFFYTTYSLYSWFSDRTIEVIPPGGS